MTDFDQSERLLTHAAGLRRLAHTLVRDAQDAEDVLQETFARAFERAPARLERPGAWLRQVLRGVVHKRLRSADRRRVRELAAARDELGRDTLDIVARGELLQRVVDAVQALEPRLREVVLLRHFEGMPPREIALRTGTPLATVNGRLQRAHARLRAELDESDDGRWIPALLVCFGWDRDTRILAGSLAAGVITLSSSMLVKCGAAALALVTTAWLWPAAPSAVLDAPGDLRPPLLFAALRAPTRVITAGRRESLGVADAHAAVPFLDDGPRDFTFAVRAFGRDDLPIEGAELYLAPVGSEANFVGRTRRDGRLEVRWLGRDKTLEIDWALRYGSSGTHLARVELVAGRAYEFAGSLLDGEDDARFDPGVRHLNPYLQAERVEDGMLRFISPAAAFEELDDHNETIDRETAAGETPEGWTITGRVFREDGAPAADVVVGCGPSLARLARNRTDEQGWYTLTGYSSGRLVVFAGGGDDGRTSSTLEVVAGSTYLLDTVLDRGTELCGSVIFFDGRPASDWLITVDSAGHGEAFADQTRTDAEGRFCIPNCPSAKLRVRARPGDSACAAPWAEQDGVLAASGHLPLLVPYQQAASLSLPGPHSGELHELRLFHEDSATISWMRSRSDGSWSLDGLPPGFYRLESLAGSRGGTQTAPFYVFPEEEVSLYPWLVPLRTDLTLVGMPPGEFQRFRFERLDGPLRIDLPADAFDGPPERWPLPPGDYRMHVAGHPEWTRELHLVEGQRLWVELEPEEDGD